MQASSFSNDILIDLVMKAAPEKMKRAADLFCGRGTFSLPLSTLTKVDSYELDKPALSALERAKNKHSRPINTSVRNLFQEPLTNDELNKYDYVVINPPRAGALKQCQELAKTAVPIIIMVSCDPKTFARDAHALIAGGYKLNEATPVDQFLWSDHIEVVGTFYR
jgi:23S rRNA (uracil1939-C5)-methyltransferase